MELVEKACERYFNREPRNWKIPKEWEEDEKIAKYKIENLKEEISDFNEILEIMRGEE